jgi:hypothetical protein
MVCGLNSSAEVKLFFLPCWVTPMGFFDHHLGMVLLTLKIRIGCYLKERDNWKPERALGIKNDKRRVGRASGVSHKVGGEVTEDTPESGH